MPQIVQGGVITLSAQYTDGDGDAANPTSPLVDIIDALGATVVNNAVPTPVGPIGLFDYVYDTAADAPLGTWQIVWTGLVLGEPATVTQEFEVLALGQIQTPTVYDNPSMPCAAFTTPGSLRCDAPADPTITDDAIAAASFVLWALGGRQHGLCTTTIRPCRWDLAMECCTGGLPYPQLIDGRWYNVCGHQSTCGCSSIPEISLPYGPVENVSEVKIDGVVLDPADYRLDNRGILVRLDGEPWPTCQDLLRPATEVGTFSITFTHGVPLDHMGRLAAGEMACEFVKMWGGGKCRLPERVQTITRQSVTWTLLDPQQFLTEGRTGLYFVDLWLSSVNPSGEREPSSVFNIERYLAGGAARRVGT